MRLRLSLALLASLLLIAACGSAAEAPAEGTALKLAPASALPAEIRQLSPEVQEAYRFALANPDILAKIPCYCGCSHIGHMDNYMCYVQPGAAGGQVVFDYHGAG